MLALKSAFHAGSNLDPHDHHPHTDVFFVVSTRCTRRLWVFRTITFFAATATTTSVFWTLLSAILRILPLSKFGVPGQGPDCIAGVAGIGRFPSSVGLQPDLTASVTDFRTCSSVTHFAVS